MLLRLEAGSWRGWRLRPLVTAEGVMAPANNRQVVTVLLTSWVWAEMIPQVSAWKKRRRVAPG